MATVWEVTFGMPVFLVMPEYARIDYLLPSRSEYQQLNCEYLMKYILTTMLLARNFTSTECRVHALCNPQALLEIHSNK